MKKIFSAFKHLDSVTICVYIGGLLGVIAWLVNRFLESPAANI